MQFVTLGSWYNFGINYDINRDNYRYGRRIFL